MATRGWERGLGLILSELPEGTHPAYTLISDFGLEDCETIHFCFKPLILWSSQWQSPETNTHGSLLAGRARVSAHGPQGWTRQRPPTAGSPGWWGVRHVPEHPGWGKINAVREVQLLLLSSPLVLLLLIIIKELLSNEGLVTPPSPACPSIPHPS